MTEQNTLSISQPKFQQEWSDSRAREFSHTLQQAINGDVQAQIDLACCYSGYIFCQLSEMVYKNKKGRNLDTLRHDMRVYRDRTFEWLKKAAEENCVEAQYLLLDGYSQSKGYENNDALAFEWLKKAAEQNCVEAQYLLSDCYLQSIGVEHSPPLAFEWLKKAAEENYVKAQYGLAYCYLTGSIAEQNETLAFRWFKSAFEQQKQEESQKQAEYLYWLAYCSFESNNSEKNETLAFAFFKKTAGQGTAEVEYLLAHCYFKGKGVDKSDGDGIDWMIRAARLGHTEANNWLANAYLSLAIPSCLSGKEGGEQYYKFAADRCRKEVDGHNAAEANLLLGVLYFSGKGVEQNNKRALECFEKALDAVMSFHVEDIFEELCPFIEFYFWNCYVQCKSLSKYSGFMAVVSFFPGPYGDFEKGIMDLRTKGNPNHKEFLVSLNVAIYKKAGEYRLAKDFLKEVFNKDEDMNKNFLEIYLTSVEQEQEIAEKNKALESEIKQKDSANHRMQKLVEQFTHSLGNVIFPDTIYQVAERLKNNPECRKDVLLLHEAYHSEIIIKLQGELLRQRYANTNPEKFRQFIRSCRRTQNHPDKTKSIEDILDYAASRVTARFLNQHYAGLTSIRDKILSKKNVSHNALKQKFEDDILLNTSLRPIAWINQNLRPIQIAEISPLWKKVFILSESHAEALLFGYFSEILFNAFKYADHDKDEFLTLVFDEKTINDKMYLSCCWENPVKDKSPSMLGTGKGLNAIQEDLKQLNNTENPGESLLISQQKNQFQVTLFFKKDLLVNELPSLKIKRQADME